MNLRLATANTPGYYSHLSEPLWIVPLGADQGATTISTTGVLAFLSSSADKGLIEPEPSSQPGGSQPVQALSVAHHRKRHLFQHHLVLSLLAKDILAPAFHIAALAQLKVLLIVGQANGVNMVGELKISLHKQKSNGIAKIPRVELSVAGNVVDWTILMIQGFSLSLRVPLTTPHHKISRVRFKFSNFVSSGENHTGSNEGGSSLENQNLFLFLESHNSCTKSIVVPLATSWSVGVGLWLDHHIIRFCCGCRAHGRCLNYLLLLLSHLLLLDCNRCSRGGGCGCGRCPWLIRFCCGC